jgi:hypothetical protein
MLTFVRPTNDLKGNSRGILHASQGGLSGSSPLRSDGSRDRQMGLSCVSGVQKKLMVGHEVRVHSGQMVLLMVRQGGWTAMRQWPKTLKTNLNLKGDY